MTAPAPVDQRILVLAPSANDGPVTVRLLTQAGVDAVEVASLPELCAEAARGVGALLIAEESIAPLARVEPLLELLRRQEPWSDLPLVLFTGGRLEELQARRPSVESLAPLGNVTVLERPVRVITLLSAVRAALRARRRQYAARAVLDERERVEAALRASEAALRDSDRRKTEFLGVLSHELRNPLAPIRNGIALLQRVPAGSDQAGRARDVIRRQTDHLARLVDDLLDVTRIARGKVVLQRTLLDAAEVVRRTCEDHRTLFEARGLALVVDAPGPAWVDADATRLAQVVGNLLQNASRFTAAGGRAEVTVTAAEGEVEIRVRDEGVGIAPELLPRLFEPFVQADASLSRGAGGLGLGLSLVKGIVELHGGSVAATSEGLGRGAELRVRLPAASAASAAPAPVADAQRAAAPAARRVVVIDDNVDSARTVAELLELDGHEVHVAHDGRTGVDAVRSVRPDVVLCDLGLPDLDGYGVARLLRADAALGATRLVALSGYGAAEDRERARRAGFDAHLVKPATAEALLRSVHGGRV